MFEENVFAPSIGRDIVDDCIRHAAPGRDNAL